MTARNGTFEAKARCGAQVFFQVRTGWESSVSIPMVRSLLRPGVRLSSQLEVGDTYLVGGPDEGDFHRHTDFHFLGLALDNVGKHPHALF